MKRFYKKKSAVETKLFAAASKQGILVDQHFGHTDKFFIFSASSDACELIETRQAAPYCDGDCEPKQKMADLIDTLSDCSYVLCSRIGYAPAKELNSAGIRPIEAYGRIDETAKAVASGIGENEIYRIAWSGT